MNKEKPKIKFNDLDWIIKLAIIWSVADAFVFVLTFMFVLLSALFGI